MLPFHRLQMPKRVTNHSMVEQFEAAAGERVKASLDERDVGEFHYSSLVAPTGAADADTHNYNPPRWVGWS